MSKQNIEPTMTINNKYEIPVKKVLKPINNIKKILNEKKSDEIQRVKAFKIEIE